MWIMASEQLLATVGIHLFPSQFAGLAIPAMILVVLIGAIGVLLSWKMIFPKSDAAKLVQNIYPFNHEKVQ